MKGIIAFARECGIRVIEAGCAHENEASGKVLKKCGMTFDHKDSFRHPFLNIVYEKDNYILYLYKSFFSIYP